MTKSYADTCLERAEKATEGPWTKQKYSISDEFHVEGPVASIEGCVGSATFCDEEDAEFIAHSRTDVPELARRLKIACETLEALSLPAYKDSDLSSLLLTIRTRAKVVLDELEAMPEEK